ncbi:hypothetical protein UT300015_07950 [Clostridium tertium]
MKICIYAQSQHQKNLLYIPFRKYHSIIVPPFIKFACVYIKYCTIVLEISYILQDIYRLMDLTNINKYLYKYYSLSIANY